MLLLTRDEKKSQRKTTDMSKVECFKCGRKGHYANSPECPLNKNEEEEDDDTDDLGDDKEGVIELNIDPTPEDFDNVDLEPEDFDAFHFVQLMNRVSKGKSKTRKQLALDVLLDNQANINMFCNPDLLTNIRKGPRTMTVHCQAGSTSTDLIGFYKPLNITVWYNPDGIANVLSLSKLVRLNKAKIQYNSDKNEFIATSVKDDQIFEFPCNEQGLYSLTENGDSHGGTILVSTVKEKMSKYSNRQVRRAVEARKFQQIIGCVSDMTPKNIVKHGTITLFKVA